MISPITIQEIVEILSCNCKCNSYSYYWVSSLCCHTLWACPWVCPERDQSVHHISLSSCATHRLSPESHWVYPRVNTRRWPIVSLTLGQRRRRWTNVRLTLVQYLPFYGVRNKYYCPWLSEIVTVPWLQQYQSPSRVDRPVITINARTHGSCFIIRLYNQANPCGIILIII